MRRRARQQIACLVVRVAQLSFAQHERENDRGTAFREPGMALPCDRYSSFGDPEGSRRAVAPQMDFGEGGKHFALIFHSRIGFGRQPDGQFELLYRGNVIAGQ